MDLQSFFVCYVLLFFRLTQDRFFLINANNNDFNKKKSCYFLKRLLLFLFSKSENYDAMLDSECEFYHLLIRRF